VSKVKRKTKAKTDNILELAADIASSLDKEFKATEFKSAYFLSEDDVSNVTDFVPTGLDILDLAIANRPNGGWPVGRITEITGLEASGKSLLAAYALKNTQKKGGVAVYIDTEAAVSKAYLEAIGVDIKRLLYVPLEAIEDAFTTIDIIIEKVRKKDKDRLVTIVVDSVMGATTKVEQASEHGKDGYATAKAIIISKALRKITNKIARQKICLIFTNQLRVRMGVMFGDKYCVDPHTTEVKLRNTAGHIWTESLFNLMSTRLPDLISVYKEIKSGDLTAMEGEPYIIADLTSENIEIETSVNGELVYKPIINFIIKTPVDYYYTDGKLKGTANHIIIEDGKQIELQNHPDFKRVEKKMPVVDIEVADAHTYLANGRLNHNTTSGGKGLPFHSSVRVRLKSMGKIKVKSNGIDNIVGVKTECSVVKNRLGPPMKKVKYDIYYSSGIDNYGSWLSILKDYKIVKSSGAWYTYKLSSPLDIIDEEGEVTEGQLELKFQSKDFATIVDRNPELKSQILDIVHEKYIMKYEINKDYGIDDIVIDEEAINEEG